ncbi:hypothetical protein J2X07_003036 [Fictibacillus barbaricus]|uniref:Uncharacterized protein n=1 Tax=Fictibacillus barbaricus TaxID=182136 RepID=A0ABU1U3T9_9BACL|nr:hypothetical protein [Fictibacillus barbaricus]
MQITCIVFRRTYGNWRKYYIPFVSGFLLNAKQGLDGVYQCQNDKQHPFHLRLCGKRNT